MNTKNKNVVKRIRDCAKRYKGLHRLQAFGGTLLCYDLTDDRLAKLWQNKMSIERDSKWRGSVYDGMKFNSFIRDEYAMGIDCYDGDNSAMIVMKKNGTVMECVNGKNDPEFHEQVKKMAEYYNIHPNNIFKESNQ